MQHKRARSTAISVAVAVVAAITVAACGSSATTGSKTTGSSGASTSRTKLVACLKQHGVTLPSRAAGAKPPNGGTPPAGGYGGGGYGGGGYGGGGTPPGGGGGFFGGGAGGANGAQSSKFRAAFKACGANFGGGRFANRGGAFKPSTAALAKFTSCVDKHGYTLPKANTSGKGPIFPKSIESNKKFEAAAKVCQSDLRPSGAPPGAGGSSGSSGPAA